MVEFISEGIFWLFIFVLFTSWNTHFYNIWLKNTPRDATNVFFRWDMVSRWLWRRKQAVFPFQVSKGVRQGCEFSPDLYMVRTSGEWEKHFQVRKKSQFFLSAQTIKNIFVPPGVVCILQAVTMETCELKLLCWKTSHKKRILFNNQFVCNITFQHDAWSTNAFYVQ